jgi:hypothetical protein
MNAFNTIHKTYYINKDNLNTNSSIKINTIDYNYNLTDALEITGLNKAKLGKKANFSQLCKDYFSLIEEGKTKEADKIALIHPIIKEAHDLLGKDKMEALKLQKLEIERELVKMDSLKSKSWKIAKLLGYRIGQWVTREDVKSELEFIYKDLGLNLTAKATDLENYYEIKKTSKRIDNKSTQGFVIILSKFKK